MKVTLIKATILFFILFVFNRKMEAQTKVPLSDASIETVMIENQKKGLDHYHGLTSSFAFQIEERKIYPADEEIIINEIKQMKGITSCVYDKTRFEFVVEAKKQKENVYLSEVKKVLATHEIKLLNYSEKVFKN